MTNASGILGTGMKLINKLERSYEFLRDEPQSKHADEEASVTRERDYYRRTERLVMPDTCNSIEKWARGFFQIYEKAVDNFSEWYNTAQTAVIQPEILMQNMVRLRMDLGNCERDLNIVVAEFQSNLKTLTDELTDVHTNRQLRIAARDSNANRAPARAVNAANLNDLKVKINEQMEIHKDIQIGWAEHLELQKELDKIARDLTQEVKSKLCMSMTD
jgi:hypothetical protein